MRLNRVAGLMHVDGLKGIPCKKKHRNVNGNYYLMHLASLILLRIQHDVAATTETPAAPRFRNAAIKFDREARLNGIAKRGAV